MLGFRQRSLHSAGKRLRIRLLAWFSNRPPNSQRIYVVGIRGHRYKRIVFPDSHQAHRVAENLAAFGETRIYPSLILERENELWVEYIEGLGLDRVDAEVAEKIAALLGVLYARNPRLVPLERLPFKHALHTDLKFLHEVGVLAEGAYRKLDGVADRLAPREAWVGYDCTDAILKNFLRCPDGRVRAVDVESLCGDQLLGVGAAKACLRWLETERERFLAVLRAEGIPDFQAYLPFVELCFLTFWQKSSFLEKKRRFVDARLFDRFLEY